MRCAIYTRKSKEDARDSQLKSGENQRGMCEKFIASQAYEGWTALAEYYDDEGYSGSTLKRPALERLLSDARAGKIDLILVYKIDRLSRSLRDFLNLVEIFDRSGVGFLSTTQQFSTATPLGRLTLNILLTFAQFERELIGERRRDWVAGARARGIWTSGPPPYGYRLENKRLAIHPDRAGVVRYIFKRFPKIQSYQKMAQKINALGHMNRRDAPFDGRLIKAVLFNRTYLGEVAHHPRIVTRAAWNKAHEAVDLYRAKCFPKGGKPRLKNLAHDHPASVR